MGGGGRLGTSGVCDWLDTSDIGAKEDAVDGAGDCAVGGVYGGGWLGTPGVGDVDGTDDGVAAWDVGFV